MLRIKSKRLLLGSCFFVLFISNSFSQVAGDYRSAATGLWSAAATWQRFDGAAWVATLVIPSSTDGVITIRATHTVTISAANVLADQIIVENTGILSILTPRVLTINNGAGTDLQINAGGTVRCFTGTATLTINASANVVNNGTLAQTVTTAIINNNGIITNSGTITSTLNTNFRFLAGSTYQHSFSSAAATAGVIPSSTWNATSTCEILACGNTGSAPTGLGQAFGHFIWNNTTQPIDINFLGTMNTPTTGNFTLSSTNGFNIILVSSAAGGATSIGGNFILTSGNITIIKVNNINKTNQLSVTGTYTQTGGIMTISNCTGSLAGNTANGTLTVGGVSNISGGIVNVNTSSWVGAGGNGTYSAANLITLSGTGVINGCSSSAVASTGVSGTITATGGLTVNAGGTLNLNTSTTTGGGGSTVLNSAGTVTLSGGIINMASGGAVASSTGCNGTMSISGGAGLTISSGTLNLSSSLTTTGGGNGIVNVAIGAFSHTGGTVSKTGANSGTININGTTAQTIRSGGFNAGNIITFNIIQSLAAGTTTIATSYTVANGTTFNINENSSNTSDLTVGFPFVNNGVVNVLTSAELDMGLINMTGTGNFTTTTDATLLTKSPDGIAASAMTGSIQVSGTRTYASDGNYTYNATATSQITGNGLPSTLNGGILNIANTLAPAAGGVTLTQATTILEGASATGMLLFGGATNGRLITTSTNLITIGDDVTVSPTGGANAKFVDGPIKKIGDDLFIFPTGDVYLAMLTYPALATTATAKWARIEMSAPTNITDEFTAEYHKKDDPCNTTQVVSITNGPGIDHVSFKEWWDMTRNSAALVTPTIKLYWQSGSAAAAPGTGSAISVISDLIVAECILSTWTTKGGTSPSTPAGPGFITSTIGTTFTTPGIVYPFTFGSIAGVNPLPIELLTFNGVSALTGNQIYWSTASETNNDYFELEKSSDGNEFTKLTTVDGNGTTSSIHNYEYLDVAPYVGINYYRLKQVDFDGNYSYSNIISIENELTENATVSVFPNPSNDIVNIVTSTNYTSVVVYNMLGEVVFSSYSNEAELQFKPVSNGIYVVKAILNDGKELNTRFIKK